MTAFAAWLFIASQPWWEFQRVGAREGLTPAQIDYYININRRYWRNPEERQ